MDPSLLGSVEVLLFHNLSACAKKEPHALGRQTFKINFAAPNKIEKLSLSVDEKNIQQILSLVWQGMMARAINLARLLKTFWGY